MFLLNFSQKPWEKTFCLTHIEKLKEVNPYNPYSFPYIYALLEEDNLSFMDELLAQDPSLLHFATQDGLRIEDLIYQYERFNIISTGPFLSKKMAMWLKPKLRPPHTQDDA